MSTLKNYDIINKDNMYFGEIKYNCTNSNNIYHSEYDSNHLIDNVFITDYIINGKKVKELQSIGKNEFVKKMYF